MSQFDEWRKLLGKQVVITLDRDPLRRQQYKGQLLEFADDGDVVYKDELGFVHYCWPCLDIEEIK